MGSPSSGAGSHPQASGLIAAAVAVVVIFAAVALLYGPMLPMALTGDSYQWIQHAHRAAHQPTHLLADLDTFYRPSTTWTLVADRLLWGGFDARGYRTTSLFLHGLAALVLTLAGRRLGLGPFAATAVGLVWVTSAFADESALVVAYRFQPLLLLSWLGLIAVWPRREKSWTGLRVTAAVTMVVAAAASKETWVMTPALVAALEFERKKSLRAVLAPTALAACAVVVYVICYFVAFPGSKSYFEIGTHVAAKIPSQLAAFFYLQRSSPVDPPLTWVGILATVVMAVIVIWCLKRRVPGSLTALCVFLLPTMPTILVPYMPQRYLAIPYAGFLLLVALAATTLSETRPALRRPLRVAAPVTVVLVVVAGASIVRGDIEDYREMAAVHAELLEEADEVAQMVASGSPVGIVLDEPGSPLLRMVDSLVGYPKLYYVRKHDPYGLIDTAALFEWAAAEEGTRVQHVAGPTVARGERENLLLMHSRGAFVNRGPVADLVGELARWKESGRSTRIIQAMPLN